MIDSIIFLIGFTSGLVSGFVGSGGGLFTVPALVLTGIPAHVAIATARLGGVGLSVGSMVRFATSTAVKWSMIIPLTLVSIPAAFVGAYLIVHISPTYIEKIIGVILLLSAGALLFKPRKRESHEKTIGPLAYIAFFISRMAQAAFGSGVGVLVHVVYMKFMHMSFTEANATKRIPGFVVTVITLVIFGIEGLINYHTGLILLAGTLVGSYIGAHASLKVNEKYVTYTFIVLTVIFGTMLIV